MESDRCRDRATLSRADRQAITEYKMVMGRWSRKALAALLAGAAMALAPQARAGTVTPGPVGAVSSTHGPGYIGLPKGYFPAQDFRPDLVFLPSSPAPVQPPPSGSLALAFSPVP